MFMHVQIQWAMPGYIWIKIDVDGNRDEASKERLAAQLMQLRVLNLQAGWQADMLFIHNLPDHSTNSVMSD